MKLERRVGSGTIERIGEKRKPARWRARAWGGGGGIEGGKRMREGTAQDRSEREKEVEIKEERWSDGRAGRGRRERGIKSK